MPTSASSALVIRIVKLARKSNDPDWMAAKQEIQPIRKGKQRTERKGLVVGGGLAGMTASLRLAEQGYEVYLIEKEKELGGNLKGSFYTLKGSNPQTLLQDLIKQVEGHESIHLYRNRCGRV
jgi:heterodisulfide reductase subunit A